MLSARGMGSFQYPINQIIKGGGWEVSFQLKSINHATWLVRLTTGSKEVLPLILGHSWLADDPRPAPPTPPLSSPPHLPAGRLLWA